MSKPHQLSSAGPSSKSRSSLHLTLSDWEEVWSFPASSFSTSKPFPATSSTRSWISLLGVDSDEKKARVDLESSSYFADVSVSASFLGKPRSNLSCSTAGS